MNKKFLYALAVCFIPFVLSAEDVISEIPTPEGTAPHVESTPEPVVDPNAQAFRITLGVDYTTVGMKQANDSMNDDYNIKLFGSGILTTLDLGIAIYPFLMAGPKVGYLYCFAAGSEHNYPGPINTKTEMNAALVPIEAGAILRFELPGTSVAVSAGAYAGAGLAFISNNVDVTNGASQKASYVQRFDGLGFTGELTAALEIKLIKGVDLNINGGYRLAYVQNVKQSEDVQYSFDSITYTAVGSKGDVMQDAANTDVPFDFSGMNIGIGISLGL